MSIFCYCESSDTIRTLPENYAVANRRDGYWRVDCDAALDLGMLLHITEVIHSSHAIKWGSPLRLLGSITPYSTEALKDYL